MMKSFLFSLAFLAVSVPMVFSMGSRVCYGINTLDATAQNTTLTCLDSCAISVVVSTGQAILGFCDFVNYPDGTCYQLGGVGMCSCYCNSDYCNTLNSTYWGSICQNAPHGP